MEVAFDFDSTTLLSPVAPSNASGTLGDELALQPRFQELQSSLRTYLLDEVRSAGNTRQQSPDVQATGSDDTQGHELLLRHLEHCNDHIPLERKIRYLQVWICECAPWLDMFDQERHFGIQIPTIAQRSPAVFFALLALGARQVERKHASGHLFQDSLELYSQAITSLAPSIGTIDLEVPVTACILCVLEMMSVSPRDWHRHLEGCAAIFAHLGVNGFSGGVLQAVFWCYARMDLCAAIISNGEQSTTLAIRKWAFLRPVDSEDSIEQQEVVNDTFLQQGRTISDMYANWAVYLCARVCDLLALRTRHLELGEDNGYAPESFRVHWLFLRDSLRQWYEERPAQMLPVDEIYSTEEMHVFPRIFFAHWAAISGNQLYHTACILLDEMPSDTDGSISQGSRSPLWHARRIVGISLTNHHPGCLNNAIQPLYIAGRLLTDRNEHKTVIELLHHIEACSGWGSRWRIKDLESFWGYRSGSLYSRNKSKA